MILFAVINKNLISKDLNKSYTATGMKGQIQGFAIGDVQNYTYTYDDYGRINKITTPMGDFNYTRLANSDLISQMTRSNGVTSSWYSIYCLTQRTHR